MTILPTALSFARGMAWVGLACGALYAVGGFFIDLFTIGLNWGTALAFLALIGMPILFAAAGCCVGALVALVRGAAAASDQTR